MIGGERHVGEITRLAGGELEIVGCVVCPDHSEWAGRSRGAVSARGRAETTLEGPFS